MKIVTGLLKVKKMCKQHFPFQILRKLFKSAKRYMMAIEKTNTQKEI